MLFFKPVFEMSSVFNYKSIVYLLIVLFVIPTCIWEGIYLHLVTNFNVEKLLNSIPLVIIIRHNYDSAVLRNLAFTKSVNESDEILRAISTRYNDRFKFYKYPVKNPYESHGKFDKTRHELALEAEKALKKALDFKSVNNGIKAKKLLAHALKLDPNNPNILAEYGELVEVHDTNIILAEYFCTKAVLSEPSHPKAQECRRRTTPIVEEMDQKRLNQIDAKIFQFFEIPENNPRLKQMKKDQYFSYIYNTIAIEGNTLSLAQTRVILETRLAIGGKSLLEQNEVMGIDLALKYLNNLLNEGKHLILIDHILEIHKRVLGFVDISEAGRFRQKQVFIADHTPPPSEEIPQLMNNFVDWLNSDDTKELHPIELAALAHWRFVFLHPFQDGNGRTARLLMNFILMRANYPPSIILNEDREQYFKLIKTANEGDVRPFIRFIADCTERTIDDYLMTKHPDTVNLIPPSEEVKPSNKNLSVIYSHV